MDLKDIISILKGGGISWAITIICVYILFAFIKKMIGKLLDGQEEQKVLLTSTVKDIALIKQGAESHQTADDLVHKDYNEFKEKHDLDINRIHKRIDESLQKAAS